MNLMSLILAVSLAHAEAPLEIRRSPTALQVRGAPALDGPIRGQIAENESFTVFARVDGEGCGGDGWGRVEAGGFACLEKTELSSEAPVALPRLVSFHAPNPADYESYVETGLYPVEVGTPLVPYVYGKRWRLWNGHVWSSTEAWVAGQRPVDRLDLRHTYSFVRAVDTPKGRAFVRPNGSVVPASQLFVFPVTSFHGRDLATRPVAAGASAAWVLGEQGANVRAQPSKSGAIGALLPYHSELVVRSTPVGDGGWWEIPDALGAGVPGYVSGSVIRRWIPAPRPEEVAADELWVDVDLGQQTLALLRGDTAQFVTLISSGVRGHETPEGTFRIYDKAATGDMASLSGANEPYHVEDVPWVMHFKPRYALHGAFWHWDFGRDKSHGCVNLAPRDARTVFDRVLPTLPPGFTLIRKTETELGTLVRIRG